MAVSIDTEKLAFGLERGILDSSTMYRHAPQDAILRIAPCGLVSAAISRYLTHEDISHTLMISRPELSCDPKMQHVFPVVGEGQIIDASYSQFFDYVGITVAYEVASQKRFYPIEKVIDFPFSERETIAEWMAGIACRFARENGCIEQGWRTVGNGPLRKVIKTAIQATYSSIWNPSSCDVWLPPDYAEHDGEDIARHIPKDAIIVT